MMNEDEYLELLERIEQELPTEPLLSALRGGYSALNVIFMAAAAKRLPPEIEQESGITEDIEMHPEDGILNGLYDDKRSLFGQLSRQSNVFHKCGSDEERAQNSRDVLAIWSNILEIKAKIAYYLEHNELPKVDIEGDDLPENAVLLGKKLNSIRAHISQIKKRLESLFERPDDDKEKKAHINEAEDLLKKKMHLKGLAEQKLKSLENG